MTYEEILEVPVEERTEKEKPEVSEDEILSTMSSEETTKKVEQEVVKEDEKNIELADNVVKENKTSENTNLPADIKPYLNMIKEKLVVLGKAAISMFEKIGDFVENLFKKKN